MFGDCKELAWGVVCWWSLFAAVGIAMMVIGGAAIGGVPGGGYVGGHLGILLGGGEYSYGAPIGDSHLGGVLGGAVGGLLGGVSLGVLQWNILRRCLRHSAWWIVLTAGSFSFGGAVSAGGYVGGAAGQEFGLMLQRALGTDLGLSSSLGLVLGWGVGLLLFGVLIGFGQWLVLRNDVHRASLWIPVTTLAWLLGWLIGYPASEIAGPLLIEVLGRFLEYPLYWAVGEAVGWLLGWAAYGALTGTTLLLLLSQRERVMNLQ